MPKEVKKTPQVRKRPAPKAVLVRPTARKVTVTANKKPSAPKKPKATSVPKAVAPDVVVLPRTASVRLLEKVALYKAWYSDDLPGIMSRVAVGTGYAFVVFGAAFTAFTYTNPSFDSVTQSGATICSDALCTSVPDAALADSAPKVLFENSLPSEITDTIDFDISYTTSKPILRLKNLKTGLYTTLEPQTVVSDKRIKYIISPNDLAGSRYQVVAIIEQGSTEYQFEGGVFTIPTTDSPVAEAEPVLVSEVVTEAVLGNATSSIDIASSTEEALATSTEIELNETEVLPEIAQVTTRSTPAASIRTEGEAMYLVVDTGSFLPDRVEVFATAFDKAVFFLGAATFVDGEWWFSLDALSLPRVPFVLHGQFSIENSVVHTAGVTYDSVTTPGYTMTADDEIFRAKIDAALSYLEIEKSLRRQYFSNSASTTNVEIETQVAESPVIEAADVLFAEAASVIDVYLLRYASAHLVGVPAILSLADASISELATTLSAGNETVSKEDMAPLSTLIKLRLNSLLEQVRSNERSLSDATNGLITQDKDNDGFSDYDELTVYTTNPNEADTNGDGRIDSVEVFDTEAPIVQLAGAVATAQVHSKIVTHPDGSKSTLAVVEGQSIPNAHIVITHNESSVSIVKTGTQGNYSFTLDAPLSGNMHRFTISLLGTEGELVPLYTTPNLALTDEGLETPASNVAAVFSTRFDTTQAATLIASVTLTTLGFILLYLAYAVRSNGALTTRVRVKKALL